MTQENITENKITRQWEMNNYIIGINKYQKYQQ
jgi:hypothetical protein